MFYAVPVLLLLLPVVVAAAAAAPAAAADSSNGTTICSNISIPFPFSVEPGCYRPGFYVTCSDEVPPRLLLHNISEVFDIERIMRLLQKDAQVQK
nr:unnamed protein product [Digitaria exilis]